MSQHGKNLRVICNSLLYPVFSKLFYYMFVSNLLMSYDPAHDKTYNKTCVTSKDSDQPVHLPNMTWGLFYPSLDSLESVEGICN